MFDTWCIMERLGEIDVPIGFFNSKWEAINALKYVKNGFIAKRRREA